MPLQNRVTPFGEIVRHSARGLLMGNRGGRLHDPATRTLGNRRWASKQWISCKLDFRGRHREVMGAGYTELFFLDEVTALSAGHRPCFECRREAARGFALALKTGLALDTAPGAAAIDRLLHQSRLDGRMKRRHAARSEALPDGAMVEIEGAAYAVKGSVLLAWTACGYERRLPRPQSGIMTLLTPPPIIAALAGGYRPLWHPSAG